MTVLSAEPQFQLLLNKTSIEDHVQKPLSRLLISKCNFHWEKYLQKMLRVFGDLREIVDI